MPTVQDLVDFLAGIKKGEGDAWIVPDGVDISELASFIEGHVRGLCSESKNHRLAAANAKTQLEDMQDQVKGLQELVDSNSSDASGVLKTAIETQNNLRSRIAELEETAREKDSVTQDRDRLKTELQKLQTSHTELEKTSGELRTTYNSTLSNLTGLQEKLMINEVASQAGLRGSILSQTIVPGLKAQNPDKKVAISVKTEKVTEGEGDQAKEVDKQVAYVTIGEGDGAKTESLDTIIGSQFADLKSVVYTEVATAEPDKKTTPAKKGGLPNTPPAKPKDVSELSAAVNKRFGFNTKKLPRHVQARVATKN